MSSISLLFAPFQASLNLKDSLVVPSSAVSRSATIVLSDTVSTTTLFVIASRVKDYCCSGLGLKTENGKLRIIFPKIYSNFFLLNLEMLFKKFKDILGITNYWSKIIVML